MAQSLLQDKTFYGREWAFAKIAHSLENRSNSKTSGILITGGPGCGKTAFSCELIWPSSKYGKQYSMRKRILAYHFCQAQDISSLSLYNFINSLVTQFSISPLISGYVEKLNSEIESFLSKDKCESDPDEAFKKAVLYPLLELDPPTSPCIVLVDSIDESYLQISGNKDDGSKNIAELLATHHHSFPPWLLLICSARKQSKSVTRLYTGFKKVSLDDLRKSHVVRDVQQYILNRLDKEEQLRQHLNKETAEMLNQLHIKSNGCFIYLEKVLDGVAENFIMLREVREIPGTLNGLYLWLCQRLFIRKQFLKVQPILNVILVARRPLTEQQLFHCVWTKNTTLTYEEFNKRLLMLSKLLIEGRGNTKLLFHHSFAEWLLDVKHCTQKYLCNSAEGHGMVAMRYTLNGANLNPEEVYDFALHLSKINLAYPLEMFHFPLWLMLSNCPLAETLVKATRPYDKKIANILIQAGSKQPLPLEMEKEKSGLVKVPDDPIDALLLSTGNINHVDSNQRTLLHTACYEGDENLVERLLAKGADLEAIDKNRLRPLNFAARQGHYQIVKLLLEAGANPNHADSDGWTPLRSSAWAGHSEVVDLLLDHGIEVDLSDSDHRTALRAASWGGHEDIVLKLLEHKADVNKVDNEGRTALIAAAYMGHREIVEHLLDNGAEINHQDVDGRTALSVTSLCVPASKGHAGVVSLLLERGAEVDHRDKDGMTPLLVAAFEGHSEVCELLLEGDADVDHCDNNGRSPLFAAASMGNPNVVNLLLFWGAAVDSIDSEGRTVLSIAASQGNQEVVRQLLDRGLDEMHRDNGGWTPLHYGAYEGHFEICTMLLESGARINEIDNDGRIALNLAAQEGHTNLVEKLLQHDPKTVDHKAHDGKTACRVAALEGHLETIEVLLKYNTVINYKDPDGRTTLYLLSMENNIAMAELFLKHIADTEASDFEGRTPLHVSSWQGHEQMVILLLNYGANVNSLDNDQRTALQSASWQGHARIVKILLEKNAWIDHACNQGATALCIAAQEGHLEVVKVLLDYGADPGHADQFGRNPLRVAIKGGHMEVVNLLEEYITHLSELSRQGRIFSDSTTSLTSVSTTETKPCSAILCQPGQFTSPIESPQSTVDKRKSYISNKSSSKSSSNLTNSTGKSNSHFLETSRSFAMTFTQQLQQCTRKRNRSSRILSPLKEPHSPPQSPLQSPLSDHRISPELQTGYAIERSSNTYASIVINPLHQISHSDAPRRIQSSVLNHRPQEPPRVKRNGIVTNPNYKGGIVGLIKNGSSTKETNSPFGCPPLRAMHYEDSINQSSLKKETPL